MKDTHLDLSRQKWPHCIRYNLFVECVQICVEQLQEHVLSRQPGFYWDYCLYYCSLLSFCCGITIISSCINIFRVHFYEVQRNAIRFLSTLLALFAEFVFSMMTPTKLKGGVCLETIMKKQSTSEADIERIFKFDLGNHSVIQHSWESRFIQIWIWFFFHCFYMTTQARVLNVYLAIKTKWEFINCTFTDFSSNCSITDFLFVFFCFF